MDVWVRGLDGKNQKLTLTEKISVFCEDVALRFGLAPEDLRLISRAKQLNTDKDLVAVRPSDTIDLRLRLKGGGNCVGRSKKLTFEELIAQRLDAQSTQMLIEELEETTHMGDILARNPDLPFNEAAGQRALGEADAMQQQVGEIETPHFFMSVIGFRVIHCYLERESMLAVKEVVNQGIASGWRDFEVIFSKVLQKLRLLYKRAVAEEMKNDETKMQLDYALNLSRGLIDKPVQGFHPAIEALHYFVSPFPLLIWNLPKLNFWYDLALAVEKLLGNFHSLAVEK